MCCNTAGAAGEQIAPPEGRLEDKLTALLLVNQLMHTLLHCGLGDQAVHWHCLLWATNAVGHGQGQHVPPAVTAHSTITAYSQRDVTRLQMQNNTMQLFQIP